MDIYVYLLYRYINDIIDMYMNVNIDWWAYDKCILEYAQIIFLE